MGNFLVTVSSDGFQNETDHLFNRGIEIARDVKRLIPSRIVKTEWAHVASFARQNGSGTPIVIDPVTGSWLIAIGTWFHQEGFGSGSELLLLSRYFEVGPLRVAQEMEGFFVIVIGDSKTHETIVITDIMGSCHCFVRFFKYGITLSGSSLLLASFGDFSLDPVGCQEFLCTGIIYEERTIYKEVSKLGPASVFKFAGGRLQTKKKYWQITDIDPEALDGRCAVRALQENLTHAVHRISGVFSRPVCDLTGGYDSRAVVAAFLMAGQKFTTTVSGPAESRDVSVSNSLAQLLRVPHLYLEPHRQLSFARVKQALSLTDGEYDIVEYARVMEIHQTLSEHFDISINGSFGEIARGYWWELIFPRTGARRKVNAWKVARSRFAAYNYDSSLFPPEIRLDLVSHFTDVIERTNIGLDQFPNTLQMDNIYLSMRMQRWQGRIASSTNQIWPCLSPFLFRSVLETILKTKACIRQRSLLIRRMLAEFQPQLGEFPLEHGYPALPVTWKNIYRFWPLLGYYRKKIASRFLCRFGLSGSPAVNPNHLPDRLQLWREEEVIELFRPGTMKVGCLFDKTLLGDFLDHSKLQNFPFDDQWARLLSLEYTLRVLEREN